MQYIYTQEKTPLHQYLIELADMEWTFDENGCAKCSSLIFDSPNNIHQQVFSNPLRWIQSVEEFFWKKTGYIPNLLLRFMRKHQIVLFCGKYLEESVLLKIQTGNLKNVQLFEQVWSLKKLFLCCVFSWTTCWDESLS